MKKSLISAAILTAAFVAPASAAPFERGPHNCGTEQINRAGFTWSPGAAVPFSAPRATRTIYLNSKGATYKAAARSDAAKGEVTAGIIGSSAGATITIPPISSAFNWPKIATCVKEHYARFNIRVTETKPTSGVFIEAIVGGDGSEIPRGQGGGLLGIAAADNFCSVTEAGIAFSFSEAHIGIPRQDDELCATIAHEIGHLVALEHETAPKDVMSYVFISDSQTKAFLDQNSTCGTSPQDVMASCTCGGNMTNSGAKLTQFLGLRPMEQNPPSLTLVSPGDGQVGATFEVVANVTDDSEVEDVTVFIDDAAKASSSTGNAGEYKITVSGVAEGAHTLKVVARDTAGNEAMQTRNVTVVKLATGETCVANDACRGNICAMSPEGNYCTESCQVANDSCPDGFACEDIGGQQVCVESADGGCCSASPNVGAAGVLSLLVGLALFVPRRRRRS